MPDDRQQGYTDPARSALFVNDDAETAPAFCLLEITGWDDDRQAFRVTRPSQSGRNGLLVNGMAPVGPGEEGFAAISLFVSVGWQYDGAGDAPPAPGEVWGSKAGEWFLCRRFPGFKIAAVGGVAEDQTVVAAAMDYNLVEFVEVTGCPPGPAAATTTAGGGTTITSNGVTVRQGLPGAAAMGYSAHPTVPALTGWVTDQIAVAGLLVKAVVAGPTGPTINTQPSNQSVAAGAAATFTVSATASAGSLTYQWQRSTDSGSTWANVSTGTGGTTAGYTTAATTISGGSANNGDRYRVNVTDSNGTATSTAATLTVSASAGSITSSPLKNNTGTLHLSAPFEAFVLDATTGGLVVRKTGLTSHASTGVVTFTDSAIVAATAYRVVWRQTTTGAQGVEVLTAA